MSKYKLRGLAVAVILTITGLVAVAGPASARPIDPSPSPSLLGWHSCSISVHVPYKPSSTTLRSYTYSNCNVPQTQVVSIKLQWWNGSEWQQYGSTVYKGYDKYDSRINRTYKTISCVSGAPTRTWRGVGGIDYWLYGVKKHKNAISDHWRGRCI